MVREGLTSKSQVEGHQKSCEQQSRGQVSFGKAHTDGASTLKQEYSDRRGTTVQHPAGMKHVDHKTRSK